MQTDLQTVSLSQINTCPGVMRLVKFGNDPQPVPNFVIETIEKRLEQMDTLNPQPFSPGDIVRVKQAGPLHDLEMIFVGQIAGKQRVSVLLSFLGRLNEAYVDPETLEKVSSGTPLEKSPIPTDYQRKRYTRGKGRNVSYPE